MGVVFFCLFEFLSCFPMHGRPGHPPYCCEFPRTKAHWDTCEGQFLIFLCWCMATYVGALGGGPGACRVLHTKQGDAIVVGVLSSPMVVTGTPRGTFTIGVNHGTLTPHP